MPQQQAQAPAIIAAALFLGFVAVVVLPVKVVEDAVVVVVVAVVLETVLEVVAEDWLCWYE